MALRKNEAKWIESRQRWQINVQQDGERRTFTNSTPDTKGKAAAESAAESWLKEKTQRERIRFDALWAEFLSKQKLLTGEKDYAKHDSIGRTWLLPKLSKKRVKALTKQDYQDCLDAAFIAGRAKKTISSIRGSLTALYSYAKKNRISMEKPDELVINKKAPVKKKIILQPEGIKTLFSVDTVTIYKKTVPAFFIHAWRMIVITGLREAELCELRKTDIDGDFLHIRGTKTKEADRYLFISSKMREVLDDQLAMLKRARSMSPWLFPAEDRKQCNPRHIYAKWLTYRKQHGIASNIHELRHTYTSVLKSDMPLELLKMTLGHSVSTDTIGIYGHEFHDDLKRAADISDAVFERILKS